MYITRQFFSADFSAVWQAMRTFTDDRTPDTPDELWVVEHLPVYTLGQSGKREHILQPGNIPVVETDRGGQVTYHGPGQLVVYTLVDIKRRKMGIRHLVSALENSVIQLLADFHIHAYAKSEAPGVYVAEEKICSIGLRVRHGCAYHGLALNVAMDLNPFLGINPCGYKGLRMTQLKDLGVQITPQQLAPALLRCLDTELRYTTPLS